MSVCIYLPGICRSVGWLSLILKGRFELIEYCCTLLFCLTFALLLLKMKTLVIEDKDEVMCAATDIPNQTPRQIIHPSVVWDLGYLVHRMG